MIPAEYTDWLDIVADLPESDLPCNASTVAYAIKVALLLRDETKQWQALFDEALAHGARLDEENERLRAALRGIDGQARRSPALDPVRRAITLRVEKALGGSDG